MDMAKLLEISVTIAGAIASVSLAVIAFFIGSHFKSTETRQSSLEKVVKDNESYSMRKISNLESDMREHQTVIKSNREILETSISLQNQFIKEEIFNLKGAVKDGFEKLERSLSELKV